MGHFFQELPPEWVFPWVLSLYSSWLFSKYQNLKSFRMLWFWLFDGKFLTVIIFFRSAKKNLLVVWRLYMLPQCIKQETQHLAPSGRRWCLLKYGAKQSNLYFAMKVMRISFFNRWNFQSYSFLFFTSFVVLLDT